MGDRVAVKVVAKNGIDIYDSPNGKYKGHYDCGDIIRTLEPNSSKPANDGRVYACYTVGGHRNMKYWVPIEDEQGNATVQQIDYK